MNRLKLQRRTALAAKISDRHNPAYRLVCTAAGVSIASASTRDENQGRQTRLCRTVQTGSHRTPDHARDVRKDSVNVMKAPDEMTMAKHAEAWQQERGRTVPDRGTPAWDRMYFEWHNYAFEDFGVEDFDDFDDGDTEDRT